jgi:pilus assembly protein CpaF
MSIFFSTGAATREKPKPGASAPLPARVQEETVFNEIIAQRPALLDDKLKLHAKIIDEFNLTLLERMPREELVRELSGYVADYVRAEKIPLNQREMQAFAEDLVDEMTGFGPIESLLKDPTVTDILINTHRKCFVERFGKLEETTVHFKDEAHLLRIVHKIVSG